MVTIDFTIGGGVPIRVVVQEEDADVAMEQFNTCLKGMIKTAKVFDDEDKGPKSNLN